VTWREILARRSVAKWGLIALLVACALAYLRFAPDSLKPWTPEKPKPTQPGEPAVVTKIEKVVVPGPVKVITIEKVKYIEKLPGALQPSTVQDNSAHVIASATIPPSPAGGTASAILQYGPDNVASGRIEYLPAQPPFIAVQKEFGVRVGMGTHGLVLGELYARPLRVGPVTVEGRVYGRHDRDSGSDFGAVVLVDYRF